MTCYPSTDKPWLKYYKPGAEEASLNIPTDKTVWDVIEEKLLQYKDIPAIEYFGHVITRPEFIDMVYTWARSFKALGVKEDEIVVYYGPLFPDICAMTFALNMIGACPYFVKLAITPDALAEETKECRIAIAYEDMWQNVSGEFTKDRFEKVIIINASDGMAGVKKQIASLLSKLKSKQNVLSSGDKYLSITEAKALAKEYEGELKVPFVTDRPAFITSSSGTTVGGVVKGVIATNESALAQSISIIASDVQYLLGYRVLNQLPPSIATCLNSLVFMPLITGETIIIDPRVSADDFKNQIVQYKPNICLAPGCCWEAAFNKIIDEMKQGKKFDFSYAKQWVIGGEGTSVKKIRNLSDIVRKCGGDGLVCGYGLSETFSGVTFDKINAKPKARKEISEVGIPQAGMTIGIFDASGKELTYNQRGELWVKTKAAMKGYYNKPELTAQTKINGWIHTGDLAEIDENGFVYIWGRIKDAFEYGDNQKIYLFDVAYKMLENDFIEDVIVLPMIVKEDSVSLVAHIVWNGNPTVDEQKKYIEDMNALMKMYLPKSISMAAYSVHDVMLPYSPTTLKKDKNKLSKQITGYVQVVDGQWMTIHFEPNENSSTYTMISNYGFF